METVETLRDGEKVHRAWLEVVMLYVNKYGNEWKLNKVFEEFYYLTEDIFRIKVLKKSRIVH